MRSKQVAVLQREMRQRWSRPAHRKRYGKVIAVLKERFVEEFPNSQLGQQYQVELEAEHRKNAAQDPETAAFFPVESSENDQIGRFSL